MSEIVRTPHDDDHPYVLIEKRITEDATLSWEARGVLVFMLSRPSGPVHRTDLVLQSPARSKGLACIIAELVEHGHLTRDLVFGRYTLIDQGEKHE